MSHNIALLIEKEIHDLGPDASVTLLLLYGISTMGLNREHYPG